MPTLTSLTVLLGIFLVSPTSASTEELLDKIAAVVNNEVIFLSEVEDTSKKLVEQMKSEKKDLGSPDEIRKRVLDQLINDRLVDDEISRRGLTANDGMVDAYIAGVMRENNLKGFEDLKKALTMEGLTLEEYKSSIKKQMERHNLVGEAIRSRVQITDQDVEAAYRREIADESGKPLPRIRMIFKKRTPSKDDLKAMQRLKREVDVGIPFERLANRETEGPGKGQGGDIGTVAPGDLQPELSKAIEKLKPGQTSEVIQTDQGYYLLHCVEMIKTGSKSLEQMRDSLKEKLVKAETDRQFDAFIRGLRDKAHIEVHL